MNLNNPTKNQHFISQSEQRLNAIDISIDKKRQRIYHFSLIDRESYRIKLVSDNGRKIEKNLSLNDLFSFDVTESGKYNFEKIFQEYENTINLHTKNLLTKISDKDLDIKSEIINIFLYKIINFTRNPYSIKKMMNSFPSMYKYHPTNSKHKAQYDKIISGVKPHQKLLCKELNISEKEYSNWLSTIFLLLNRFDNNSTNFIERIV